MKYNVGDKVRIKSIDWYNENKDKYGYIDFDHIVSFLPYMSKYCGEIATIKRVDRIFKFYDLDIDDEGGCWSDDMFDD